MENYTNLHKITQITKLPFVALFVAAIEHGIEWMTEPIKIKLFTHFTHILHNSPITAL